METPRVPRRPFQTERHSCFSAPLFSQFNHTMLGFSYLCAEDTVLTPGIPCQEPLVIDLLQIPLFPQLKYDSVHPLSTMVFWFYTYHLIWVFD